MAPSEPRREVRRAAAALRVAVLAFASVTVLIARIRDYLTAWNTDPKPSPAVRPVADPKC